MEAAEGLKTRQEVMHVKSGQSVIILESVPMGSSETTTIAVISSTFNVV